MVAATDGISEMEGFELDMIQGRIRMLLDAKSAVTEYEKSGDMKKALSNLKEPLMLTHVMKFGMADHIQAIDKEVRDLVDDAHETALKILRNNLPLLESISQKILQEEVIEGEDLKTLLAESKMPA